MSDRLKEFIKNKREDFDDVEVPELVWEKIEVRLDAEQKPLLFKDRVVKISVLIRYAAIVLLVCTAGIVFIKYQKKQASSIGNINKELAKQQVQFASMIEVKRNAIKQIEKKDPLLYHEFNSEIKEMDISYQKLKKDLPNSPNQEETVKAMIRNLQVQLEVLNQQLKIIENVNQIKKDSQNETYGI